MTSQSVEQLRAEAARRGWTSDASDALFRPGTLRAVVAPADSGGVWTVAHPTRAALMRYWSEADAINVALDDRASQDAACLGWEEREPGDWFPPNGKQRRALQTEWWSSDNDPEGAKRAVTPDRALRNALDAWLLAREQALTVSAPAEGPGMSGGGVTFRTYDQMATRYGSRPSSLVCIDEPLAPAGLDSPELQPRMPRPGDQPAPSGGEGDCWAELIAKLPAWGLDGIADVCHARRNLGIARYGQPLRYHDGRDNRRDLREELLDAAAYAWKGGLTDTARHLLASVADPFYLARILGTIDEHGARLHQLEAEVAECAAPAERLRSLIGPPDAPLSTLLAAAASRIAKEEDTRLDRDALLAYLSGDWVACRHDGIGLPGCPTCEGRWTREVRAAAQSHRDRVAEASRPTDLGAALLQLSRGNIPATMWTDLAVGMNPQTNGPILVIEGIQACRGSTPIGKPTTLTVEIMSNEARLLGRALVSLADTAGLRTTLAREEAAARPPKPSKMSATMTVDCRLPDDAALQEFGRKYREIVKLEVPTPDTKQIRSALEVAHRCWDLGLDAEKYQLRMALGECIDALRAIAPRVDDEVREQVQAEQRTADLAVSSVIAWLKTAGPSATLAVVFPTTGGPQSAALRDWLQREGWADTRTHGGRVWHQRPSEQDSRMIRIFGEDQDPIVAVGLAFTDVLSVGPAEGRISKELNIRRELAKADKVGQ